MNYDSDFLRAFGIEPLAPNELPGPAPVAAPPAAEDLEAETGEEVLSVLVDDMGFARLPQGDLIALVKSNRQLFAEGMQSKAKAADLETTAARWIVRAGEMQRWRLAFWLLFGLVVANVLVISWWCNHAG